MQLIMSLLGMVVLIFIAIIFSSNRRTIKFRTVFGAFVIQMAIGAFVLYIPAGRRTLETESDVVSSVIGYGQVGMDFVFGGLVSNKLFGGSGFIFCLT